MDNVLTALAVAAQLLQQLEAINALIMQAQISGVDITPAQLTDLAAQYKAVHAQLDADMAAAQAVGK